jgi:type IV pilus assembly protein PilY1
MPYDPNGFPQTIAIRYPDITTSKTSIQFASISMHIKQIPADTGDVVIKISGEKQANSSAFSTTSHDITNRTKTTNSVLWNIPNGAVGEVLATPDLSTIVQEIMDSTLWSSGNPICFIFERDNATSTSTATRHFSQDDEHVTIDGVEYETPLFSLR